MAGSCEAKEPVLSVVVVQPSGKERGIQSDTAYQRVTAAPIRADYA